MRAKDLKKRIETYRKKGWHPVPYAHHPPAIKEALRDLHMRPMMKECWRNSQQFFFDAIRTLELPGLEYYEGYATGVIPVEHAWLKYEGNVLDLTLKDDGKRQIIYGKSHVYSWEEVREGIFRNRCWAPIDPVALRQLRE